MRLLLFAVCIILLILLIRYYGLLGTTEGITCRSPQAIAAAKYYYDNIGDYHGVFTMDPISAQQVDDNNCDIKYVYVPTQNSPRNDSLVDFRRFTYDGPNVVLMGDWKSGVTNT